MRGMVKYLVVPAALGFLTILPLSVVAWPGFVASAQSGPALGIDADPTGNTATSLGTRNVCIAVHKGDTFPVDITVENVQGLAAFEAYVALDVNTVHIVDRNVQQLLASVPGANPFDTSESVPEGEGDDGRYRVGGAIIAEKPLSVDGSGVLARLTLEAANPGVSTLSLRPIQTSAGTVGPVLTDINANHIADNNGDSFFDGPILDAQVAVDQDCPASQDGGPAAVLSGGGGGGVPAWVFAAGAVGLVAAAGFGGIAFIRLRRPGSKTTS